MQLELTPADTDYVQGQVTDEPTDDEVKAIAQTLLQRKVNDPQLVTQAETAVRRIVNLNRQARLQQKAIEAGKHYAFAHLSPQATKQHPVYQPYKVYARDFSSFCKANGLSEKEMLRVAHGEVDSSKGWRQGQFPGSLGISRAKVIERNRPGPPMVSGPFFVSSPTIGRNWDAPAAPVFLPVKVYTPAD